MIRIGIIGFGVVGKAINNTVQKKYKTILYDKYQRLDKFELFEGCDFIFISVPTPFDCHINGVDDSAIIESLEKLSKLNYKGIVIIKSTVPPGSCERYVQKSGLKIVFNPEFLRESTTPNEDFENQDTLVIGTDSNFFFNSVRKMYEPLTVENAEFFHTSLKEAEMIKTAQNTMLASRVALANMIYEACEKHQLDYENLKKIAFDRFEILGPHMTKVPGPDGKLGFGGKCLPKDIRAFSTIFESKLLNQIIDYNDSLRNDLDNYLDNYNKR